MAEKKKNGEAVSVFWDVQCLNYGQNWEKSFVQGLCNSRVILLLISEKVIEDSNAYYSLVNYC